MGDTKRNVHFWGWERLMPSGSEEGFEVADLSLAFKEGLNFGNNDKIQGMWPCYSPSQFLKLSKIDIGYPDIAQIYWLNCKSLTHSFIHSANI